MPQPIPPRTASSGTALMALPPARGRGVKQHQVGVVDCCLVRVHHRSMPADSSMSSVLAVGVRRSPIAPCISAASGPGGDADAEHKQLDGWLSPYRGPCRQGRATARATVLRQGRGTYGCRVKHLYQRRAVDDVQRVADRHIRHLAGEQLAPPRPTQLVKP